MRTASSTCIIGVPRGGVTSYLLGFVFLAAHTCDCGQHASDEILQASGTCMHMSLQPCSDARLCSDAKLLNTLGAMAVAVQLAGFSSAELPAQYGAPALRPCWGCCSACFAECVRRSCTLGACRSKIERATITRPGICNLEKQQQQMSMIG